MTAVLQATDALRNDRLMAPHDDISYSSQSDWKSKYMEVADMLAETRAELDDFHASSKELEEELERELERTEKAQQELKVKVARAEHEKDEWKSKFMSLQTLHNTTTTSLQRELDTLRQEHQKIKIQLRELEMGNDDLERNERAISSSLADAEQRYSRVLEEKILLEHELLDKANVEEESQRLKDELRDANEEIVILKEQIQAALQRQASTSDITSPSPPRSVTSNSASEAESLFSRPAPIDLSLSDVSQPPEIPAKDYSPTSALSPTNGQASLLHHAGFQPPRSGRPNGTPTQLSRSKTVPASVAAPTRHVSHTPSTRPAATQRTASTMSSTSTITAVPSIVAKSRGVQMVSEMRARVRVLEQKIHTRVPRLRMGSVSGRSNAAPPPSAKTPPLLPSIPSPVPSNSSSSVKSQSVDEKYGVRARRPSIDLDSDTRTPVRDSSGWVLIMEDSPSPVKDKEKRRSSGPSAPSAFRPLSYSSSSSSTPSNTSRPPSALSQSAAPTKRSQSRLSVSTEGRSSISTNATSSTASSIPTPTSRPATPTFLPLPTSGMYHSNNNIGQKRSSGPPTSGLTYSGSGSIPGSTFAQKKRSSLGSSTSGFPPGMAHRPLIPNHGSAFTNLTVRPNAKHSPGLSLGQSRIGRPNGSARKATGGADGTESDTTGIRNGRGRAGTASALFGRNPF